MEKRELLLLVAFAAAGVVVYQLTAPPREENDRRLPIRRMVQQIGRELRANSASAEHRLAETRPLGAGGREIRVLIAGGDLAIAGTDRSDLALEVLIESTGESAGAAERLARSTTFRADAAGNVVTVGLAYPREGRQRPREIRLEVPQGLRVRIESRAGRLQISGVSEVQLVSVRGETEIRHVAGTVRGDHRNGTLTVEGARALRLTGRNSSLRLLGLLDESIIELTGGGLEAVSPEGPLEIDAQRSRVRLESPGAAVRVNLIDGHAEIDGLRHELRFDGRRASLTVELTAAAPITAFTSDGRLELHAHAGVPATVDGIASPGAIRLQDTVNGLAVEQVNEGAQRVHGALGGGGPGVSLRATRGDIIIR